VVERVSRIQPTVSIAARRFQRRESAGKAFGVRGSVNDCVSPYRDACIGVGADGKTVAGFQSGIRTQDVSFRCD
jgi:hypothetical protein